jgi:hypothetical protein
MENNLFYTLTPQIPKNTQQYFDNIVTCMSDYRRGLDWTLDLLTTYIHNS